METKIKRQGFIIWAVLCLAYIISFFHRMAIGAVGADLTGVFHISATTFATLGSMYFYAYIIMQIPTGIMVDTVGPRKTVVGGLIVASLGSILFGSATLLYQVFIGRFIVGLGVAVIFVSIQKILSNWYEQREFATKNGLTVFMGNSGAILAQSPLIAVASMLTWRYTFITMGFVTLLLAGLSFFTVKDRPSEMNQTEAEPEEDTKNILKSSFTQPEKVSVWEALFMVMKNKYVWPPFIVFLCTAGSFLALTGTWGQSYLMKVYGLSQISAGNYLVIPIVGYAIGAAALGKISDKLFTRKQPILVLRSLNFLAWGGIVFINGGKVPIEILGILLGIIGFSSSLGTLLCPCSKEINHPQHTGISTSFMNISGFIGAIIVPLLIGRTIDRYSGILSYQQVYHKAFLFCFLSVALAFIFMFFQKETGCQNIWSTLSTENKKPWYHKHHGLKLRHKNVTT